MCTQCKAVAPFTKCARHANKITCLEAQTVTLSELVTHLSPAAPRKKPTITRAQRTFIQQMARENLTPLRILHATTREFSKTLQELPELRKVQNAVNHYRRTKLGGNDRYGELAARLVASALMGREEDHDAFTFTARVHRFGKPIVGDGSVVHPFVVGVTTKALLRTAKRDPATFILHVDATFQLDQVSYPVLVCGMSDGARKFHLLALFITSQLEEKHYTDALAALQTVYAKVVGERLNVQSFMADADKAQFNGIKMYLVLTASIRT
ncbi:hypothetical protein PR002_g13610 [Phytophthora rubi]|nr:hypothetical protein PR002_g13610 [Phytophthora rubi]